METLLILILITLIIAFFWAPIIFILVTIFLFMYSAFMIIIAGICAIIDSTFNRK